MVYGIQLYSLRDITEKNLEEGLRLVSEMGYGSVEFAGFFGHGAEDVVQMLKRHHLTVSSTHTDWRELTPDRLAQTIRYHKTLGNANIIIPGADLSTPEKLDAFIDLLNAVQPKLATEGIALGYHNHAGEFTPNAWGVLTHEELEKRTQIMFQIDTYWAYVAGVDPVGLLERLRDRVRCIHLKDGDKVNGLALGEGTAPVEAVRAKAIALGMQIIVESEGCDPSGPEEVGRCMQYLRQLDARG